MRFKVVNLQGANDRERIEQALIAANEAASRLSDDSLPGIPHNCESVEFAEATEGYLVDEVNEDGGVTSSRPYIDAHNEACQLVKKLAACSVDDRVTLAGLISLAERLAEKFYESET